MVSSATAGVLTYNLLPGKHDYITFGSLLLQICLSFVICLSSVTFVHPTQGLKLSAQYFFAILYLSHRLTSVQNFMDIFQGNLSVGGALTQEG